MSLFLLNANLYIALSQLLIITYLIVVSITYFYRLLLYLTHNIFPILQRSFHQLQLPTEPSVNPDIIFAFDILPSSSFIMDDPPPLLIPLPFSINDSNSRLSSETTQTLTNFPENPIYNSTVPLCFGT